MPISSKSAGSSISAGTLELRNLVFTSPELTVAVTTMRVLPFASLLCESSSLTTVTPYPSPIKRLRMAISDEFIEFAFATTNNAALPGTMVGVGRGVCDAVAVGKGVFVMIGVLVGMDVDDGVAVGNVPMSLSTITNFNTRFEG